MKKFTMDKIAVVVPWVEPSEVEKFVEAWGADGDEDWLILHHDDRANGSCGKPKNDGVQRAVVDHGAEIVIVLDSDCYPDPAPVSGKDRSLIGLAESHVESLQPQRVDLYEAVTYPHSRGTPYALNWALLPVAASMGFWLGNGDHCAVRQLATNNAPMSHERKPIFGRYFSLCGMNLAFRPAMWNPWCRFIDVPRFDDIWMGWLWQREAYRRGFCFNLNGPFVKHSRQSNVWKNLRAEVEYLERNETLWRDIALHPSDDYESLVALLPEGAR